MASAAIVVVLVGALHFTAVVHFSNHGYGSAKEVRVLAVCTCFIIRKAPSMWIKTENINRNMSRAKRVKWGFDSKLAQTEFPMT